MRLRKIGVTDFWRALHARNERWLLDASSDPDPKDDPMLWVREVAHIDIDDLYTYLDTYNTFRRIANSSELSDAILMLMLVDNSVLDKCRTFSARHMPLWYDAIFYESLLFVEDYRDGYYGEGRNYRVTGFRNRGPRGPRAHRAPHMSKRSKAVFNSTRKVGFAAHKLGLVELEFSLEKIREVYTKFEAREQAQL